jgi:hypothetical protein
MTAPTNIASCCDSAAVSGSDHRLVRNFYDDYARIREIWGQRDNWLHEDGKQPLAVRAWDGLLCAAVAAINDGTFEARAQVLLESAKLEYEMRLTASFYIANVQGEAQPPAI